jgi:hypothetical protein
MQEACVDDDFCQQDLADKALPGSLSSQTTCAKFHFFSLNIGASFFLAQSIALSCCYTFKEVVFGISYHS